MELKHFITNQSFEILFVCILSGFGMIFSGDIIDKWKSSAYFKENDELWIIITPLLGLKGNIEMTLASRLSTMAKTGQFKNCWEIGCANILIMQIQCLLVGLGASALGFVINLLSSLNYSAFAFNKWIRLLFIGVLTSSISSLILGIATVLLVYHSWKLNLDPDNIVAPLAAAMGDTVTLFVLYYVSSYCLISNYVSIIHYILLGLIFGLYLPFLISRVNWNNFPGLAPIFTAMMLSRCKLHYFSIINFISFSGWILKTFAFRIKYLTTFQPLVNGVGGNIASVFCCILSTHCHKLKEVKNVPLDFSEFDGLFGVLAMFSVLVHVVLLSLSTVLKLISLSSFVQLLCPYLITVFSQTCFLLYISRKLVKILWNNKINPDNDAIPLITGLGDLLGTFLLSFFLAIFI